MHIIILVYHCLITLADVCCSGRLLFPGHFTIFIDRIVSEAGKQFHGGVSLSGGQVEVLLFVTDLAVLVESEDQGIAEQFADAK